MLPPCSLPARHGLRRQLLPLRGPARGAVDGGDTTEPRRGGQLQRRAARRPVRRAGAGAGLGNAGAARRQWRGAGWRRPQLAAGRESWRARGVGGHIRERVGQRHRRVVVPRQRRQGRGGRAGTRLHVHGLRIPREPRRQWRRAARRGRHARAAAQPLHRQRGLRRGRRGRTRHGRRRRRHARARAAGDPGQRVRQERRDGSARHAGPERPPWAPAQGPARPRAHRHAPRYAHAAAPFSSLRTLGKEGGCAQAVRS